MLNEASFSCLYLLNSYVDAWYCCLVAAALAALASDLIFHHLGEKSLQHPCPKQIQNSERSISLPSTCFISLGTSEYPSIDP